MGRSIAEFEGWDAKQGMDRALRAMDNGTAADLPQNGMVLEAVMGAPHWHEKKYAPGEFLGWGWTITLKLGGRVWEGVKFSQGPGHKKPPTMADVLSCLLSDASSADQPFEDWAAYFGYDADSRKAEGIYKECLATHHNLKKYLGERYEQALEHDKGTDEWAEENFRDAKIRLGPGVRAAVTNIVYALPANARASFRKR